MIIFENTFSEIYPAFNNNIIRFKSDNILQPVQAQVNVNGSLFIVYALPDGWFRFNFKEIAKTLVNQNNFADEINPDIQNNGFNYQENKGWFVGAIAIQITFTDGSIEIGNLNISFVASVYDFKEFKKIQSLPSNNFFLLPLVPKTNDRYYVKYWEGYPFDVAYYSTDNTVEFVNNGISYDFDTPTILTRLFFCDGSTDETITDILPIANGLNTISINENERTLLVDKVPLCGSDAVYIKWFNSKGCYSYWLFENFYKSDLRTSNIGVLQNDFYNLGETTSPEIQIGKNINEIISVETDFLNEMEFNLLSDIFKSPKIYLFTGLPFAVAYVNDWLEVRLTTNNQTSRQWKGQPNRISLQLELSDMPTQMI